MGGSAVCRSRRIGGCVMDVVHGGRRTAATALTLLLLGALLVGFTAERAHAIQRDGRRAHIVALTNADRAMWDLRDLGFAARLSRYAKRHSVQMARKGHIFHSTDGQLRRALGSYRWVIGGENVGVGGSLEGLQEAFMASRLHRENILRRTFERIAVGIVRADDRLWVTVIFYG